LITTCRLLAACPGSVDTAIPTLQRDSVISELIS